MTSRLTAPTLAAALLLSLSGCLFVSSSGTRGDIVFTWTFNDALTGCALVPGVASVKVEIPGQVLDNGGVFACTDSSHVDGIRLLDFAPGDYQYTVTGLDAQGNALYRRTGSLIVDRTVTVNVVLLPVAGATGGAYLTWTFPATGASSGHSATCDQLPGPVVAVQVSIDNGAAQEFSCGAGQALPGVRVDGLAAGSHTIDVSARDASGFFYFRKLSSFTVSPGIWGAQQYDLDWYAGSLPLRWSLSGTGGPLTCTQAGVTTVNVNLRAVGANTWLYGNAGFDQPCNNGGIQGTLFPYLYGGAYEIFFQAIGTAGLYQSNRVMLPTASVTAGVFPQLSGSSQLVPLTYP